MQSFFFSPKYKVHPAAVPNETTMSTLHEKNKTEHEGEKKTATVDMCAHVSHLHQTRHGGVDHDEGEELHPPVERDADDLETRDSDRHSKCWDKSRKQDIVFQTASFRGFNLDLSASPHLKKLVNAFNRVEKDNEQERVQAYSRQDKRHWREDEKKWHTGNYMWTDFFTLKM